MARSRPLSTSAVVLPFHSGSTGNPSSTSHGHILLQVKLDSSSRVQAPSALGSRAVPVPISMLLPAMQAPRHSGGSCSRLQPPRPPLEAPPRPLPIGLGPRLLPLGRGELLASFRIQEQGRVPLVVPSFCSSEALAAASPTSTTPPMPTLHGSNVPRMQESLWHQSTHPLFLGSSISDSAPSSAPDSPTLPWPRPQPHRPLAPELHLVRLSRPLLRLRHRETVEGPSASYGLSLQQASSRRPRTALVFSKPAPLGLGLLPLSLIRPPAPDRCPTPPRPWSQPRRPRLAPLGLVRPPAPKLPLVRLPRTQLRLHHRETVEGPSASYGLRLQQASSLRPQLAPPRPCTASSSRSLPRLRLNLGPNSVGLGLLPSASYGLQLPIAARLHLGLGPNHVGLGLLHPGLNSPPRPWLRTALVASMGQLQYAVSTCMGVGPFSSSSMQPPPSSTSPRSLSLPTMPEEPH